MKFFLKYKYKTQKGNNKLLSKRYNSLLLAYCIKSFVFPSNLLKSYHNKSFLLLNQSPVHITSKKLIRQGKGKGKIVDSGIKFNINHSLIKSNIEHNLYLYPILKHYF